MPLDGYTLHLLTDELKSQIVGARIEKLHQPARDKIVLSLRNRQGALKLLLSASPDSARVHLTNESIENPKAPPMLCMLLRKHLTSGVITDIAQQGLDRCLEIKINATNEIGDKVNFTLHIEIMAKRSNIILVNEDGIILDAVKRVDESQSSFRQLLPGFKYAAPPKQNKLNILTASNEEIIEKAKEIPSKNLSSALLNVLEGASPLICREIMSLSAPSDPAINDLNDIHFVKLENTLNLLRKKLSGNAKPTILLNDIKPIDFTFTDITQYGFSVNVKQHNTFSQMLEDFYFEKDRIERTHQISSSLIKNVSNLLARSERKLEGRKTDLLNCEGKDALKIYAELIFANQYALTKGSLYYDLQNYYDDCKIVRIKADPALTPAANAQKYYKEYGKLKTAEKMLISLIEESETEVEYLKSVEDAVNRADSYTAIEEIKAELYDQGYLKKSSNSKGKKIKPAPPLKYISDDGYEILVGRNNIQNENISFKLAAKDDSWFHIQKMPGSHVVVIGNGDILPERTCRQAATIAAWHSGASSSSRVPIDYTVVKELKHPKNGKPGMVIYHTYNTMWVMPDRELIMRLKAN